MVANINNLLGYSYQSRPQTTEELAISGTNVQEVSITDLISEGPIEGLVNGEASIYLAGDQLSDSNTAAMNTITADDSTTITIPAASAVNQPVTATLKDSSGSTIYLEDQLITADDATKFRWLHVFRAKSHKVRVVEFYPAHNQGSTFHQGHAHVVAWDGSAQGFFTDSMAEKTDFTKWGPTLYNLKPIVRLVTSAGETIYGTVDKLFNDTACTQENTGTDVTVQGASIRFWQVYRNSRIEKDIWVDTTNEVTIDCFIDLVAVADVKLDSGNKVIYIPKWTDKFGAISNKRLELGQENITKDIEEATVSGTTVENQKKYPGSSFEFRVGSIEQRPITQLGGVGVSSFPFTLTQAQAEVFNSTNSMPAQGAFGSGGYPSTSQLATLVSNGAIQKNIVLSESFSGAQINEIDEIKIHFEFPGGHYAALEDGTETFSGAAFNIKLFGSETGGADPSDWTDITVGEFNYYIVGWGTKKTAVSYITTLDVSTHLRVTDLKLQITRITPNGQSRGGVPTKLVLNKYIADQSSEGVSTVIDDVKINQIIATVKEKLSFPYSALASVNFSSKSFPQPPKRSYHVRGLKLAIPGNYTPRHLSDTGKAKYTGIWNGEFSNEGTSNASGLEIGKYYTDNPAWVLYDILLNDRYGLGKWLTAQDINPFQLYRVAKYCDEEVPTISGGLEPRFTANLYLTKSMEAYKVIKDMATIFRGMIYWLDGQLTTVPDMPSTPIYNFSQDNIIENSISTESTGSKTRANQYTVIWNNPLSGYKVEPIVIEDKQNILKTGKIINKKSVAFGCTSEGQAIRMGRWKAWTAINQTEIVKFKTSINAYFLAPGDIVNVQDVSATGIAFSGRITASTNSAISLDKDVATISDEAQIDGGRTRQFEFGTTGNGYAYKLGLLVLVRKVISAQDVPIVITHSGTTYTYNRGDEVTYAKVNGTSTALIGGSDSDEQVEKNILNVEDDDGNLIVLQFENATTVETKDFNSTNVSVVNGVTQIAISSPFSGTIPSHTVWSIREVYNGINTTASYKEYKILSIKEDAKKNYEIQGVEFYNSKYDAVDKDYVLAVQDPVFPPEPDYVPPPGAVYLLNDSDWRSQLEELVIQWESPRNTDGTLYESISEFAIHIDPPLPDGTELIEIKNPRQQTHRIVKIPNGVFNFGVQTFSAETHKRSKITWASINVYDKYAVSCPRTKEGVPSGIKANARSSVTGSTWTMDTTDWAMQSPGAPGTKVNNANQGTAATYQQALASMATTNKEITAAFIYFDASATTDYFKLVTHTIFRCENTTLRYWQEYDQFVSNSENVWTDCTNSADARVKLHKHSNKVEKSEGTTAFTTRFQVGDLIRVKTASNTYYGGRVAFIQNDNILYTDVQLNGTDSDLTSVDESKAIARNALRTDVSNDAVIARINRSGSTYTVVEINWSIDKTLTGLRALIVDADNTFINYNSDNTLKANPSITITADAIAYDNPEFKVTGDFTNISGSAHGDFTTTGVSGQTLTYQLHDGSGGTGNSAIPFNTGAALSFTVKVRESIDDSNEKTKTFRVIKVKDGSIGLDGKTVFLVADDYTVLYDDQGENPVFNNTSGHINLNATANNFDDAIYKFIKTVHGTTTTVQDWSDTSTYVWTNGVTTPFSKANWPTMFKVQVGEKHSGWSAGTAPSAGVVSEDSVSISAVKDGSGGISIHLSKTSVVYPVEADGSFTGSIPNSSTTIEVLMGGTVGTYIGKTDGNTGIASGQTHDNKEWYIDSITVDGNDVTLGGPTSVSNNVVTIGSHTATSNTDDSETVVYTIKTKTEGIITSRIAQQILVKSKKGAQGDSVTGPEGKKTVQGYLYHEKTGGSHASAPAAPAGNTYTISTGVVSGTGIGTGTNVWTNSPRPQAPDAASTTHYTVRYFGTQTSSTTEITVSYSAVSQYTNFTGVVTFDSGTGLFAEGATTIQTGIDGGAITTGSIQNSTYVSTSGDTGVRLNLDATGTNAVLEAKSSGTALVSINADGSATFGGTVEATGGFIGSSSSTNRWKILGHLLLGGGGTDFASSNITLDGGNSTPRIIIRDPTAGINHVVLGKLS